jgi:3-deoxy-D-arabino-heptulosonate 7-phosphate (DAHP) synthase
MTTHDVSPRFASPRYPPTARCPVVEYVMAAGNPNVILREHDIATFEMAKRDMPGIPALSALETEASFPLLVDPSHAGGRRGLVEWPILERTAGLELPESYW